MNASEESLPAPRRSKRKRSMPLTFGSVISSSFPSAKKSCKLPVSSLPVPPTTLLTLPHCVMSRLLLCLDVESLENLSATCSHFDQLIAGKFLTSINLPFPISFIKEVNTNGIEKKPLLKLESKKNRDDYNYKIFDDYSDPSSSMMDYLVLSQMSFLSLHKVRELDLVPDWCSPFAFRKWLFWRNGRNMQNVMDSHMSLDCSLFRHIARLGSLSCVTRLDVLVDENMYLNRFMSWLPNLQELGLNILTRDDLSNSTYLQVYLPRLEAAVAASKAPVLKITVLQETRRMLNKVFNNSYVEKLIVTGPCSFNMFPVMKRLKEVVVKIFNYDFDYCRCWMKKGLHVYEDEDLYMHRTGLCCVNIGSFYENCPNLERFMGVEVGTVSHKQSFAEWNKEIKVKFYDDYLHKGGNKEIKAWAKQRWFSRRPALHKFDCYGRLF